MASIALWIEAARPKTLIVSLSAILIGTSYARSLGYFNNAIFICCLLTGISIQIGTNLANDYFDGKKNADGKDRIGPIRLTGSGLVSEKIMKRATIGTFLIATLSCLFLIAKGGILIFSLLILALLLGIGYTAGPFPIAYLGLAEPFVIFGFGFLATGATAYLQTGTLELKTFLLGLAPGFASTAILVITTVRDRVQDAKNGKKTLAVRFGETFSKLEYALMLLLTALTPTFLVFFYDLSQMTMFTLALLLPAISLIKAAFRVKTREEYIPLLPKTAFFFAVFTLILCLTLFL